MTTSLETKQAYITWYLTPASERSARTVWCLRNSVAESTALRWEKTDWFMEKVVDGSVDPLDDDSDVVQALRKKAADGSERAADIYLRYKERQIQPEVVTNLSGLTDEELASALRQELAVVEMRINAAAA